MNSRFQPGGHIQAQRPALYYHHGIYISDDRVIQFGHDVNLTNKRSVGINAVPLKDFEQGGTAKVVRHGYYSLFTGWHPPADEPWKVIERAEFLLRLQPRLPYNLIGHNCEVIANMCVTGGWTESYQARRYFAARVVTDAALQLWIASRTRAKLPIPKWVLPAVAAGALATMSGSGRRSAVAGRHTSGCLHKTRATSRPARRATAQDNVMRITTDSVRDGI